MLKAMVEKTAAEMARLKEELSERDSAMADYRRGPAYYGNPHGPRPTTPSPRGR